MRKLRKQVEQVEKNLEIASIALGTAIGEERDQRIADIQSSDATNASERTSMANSLQELVVSLDEEQGNELFAMIAALEQRVIVLEGSPSPP